MSRARMRLRPPPMSQHSISRYHEDPALARERQERFLEQAKGRIYTLLSRKPIAFMADVPYVLARLIEAQRIALRRRDSIGPSDPKTCWPHHSYELEEIEEQRAKAITDARPPPESRPNAFEIQRQEEAMRWVAKYIPDDALAAAAVTHHSRWIALGLDIARMIESTWVGDAQSFDRKKRDGLAAIARGLNRDRVAVT